MPDKRGSDRVSDTTDKWEEELARLPHLKDSRLTQGWHRQDDRWQKLRDEWDRIRRLKTDVVWLANDAASAVDRKLLQVGQIIDNHSEGELSKAALGLSQAEDLIQRAWLSRWYNQWHLLRVWPVLAAWPCIAAVLGSALALTVYLIFDRELHPRGEPMELTDAFHAATLWGLAGGIIIALKTIHERVQRQQFEIQRLAWYVLSPIIGFSFGAIAFLLFLGGLLVTGQGATTENSLELDPTPILLLALLAGFAQNPFIMFVERTAARVFRDQSPASADAAAEEPSMAERGGLG